MSRKTNIFAIYAWEDKNALLQIRQSLSALEANETINIWADDPILPGQEWKPKVASHMDFADVFLLFVSTDFMKSKFVQQLEFKNVIDKYKANDAVVIPILVDDCQWQIDFKSDEYDFNLNELQVLPNPKKPIENWTLPEDAFNAIETDLKKVIASVRGESVEEAPEVEEVVSEVAEIIPTKIVEDQLELSFFDEVDTNEDSIAAQNRDAEAERLLEEAAAKKRAAAEQEKAAAIAAEKQTIALEQQRIAAEKEVQRKAEEEKRILAEQEAQKKLEREQQVQAEAEKAAQLKAEQDKLKQEEQEAQQKAAAEKQKAEEAERIATIKAAEEERLFLEEEAQREAEEERRIIEQAEANAAYQEHEEDNEESIEEYEQEEDSTSSKKSLLVLAGVLLLGVAFYVFYDSDGDTKETAPVPPETNTEVVEDAMSTEDAEVSAEADEETNDETIQEESVAETPDETNVTVDNSNFMDLEVGDSYAGGIVFEIDKSNKTALVAQAKDAGPMSWKSAMKINEQLGEDWRLPTQDELKTMYNTIGKGGDNSGGFTEELYWSSTLYQKIQSRMVRFSDGNMSFHYSNVRESRKFLVRAIKKISA
ncbi:TIR domain-containing protein [Aurantibacter sp.]|uniref:TIR domain-containing protein n=1 Tax=Aurantibacter sp. TaxID=2807103 RepID=UPI003264B6FC